MRRAVTGTRSTSGKISPDSSGSVTMLLSNSYGVKNKPPDTVSSIKPLTIEFGTKSAGSAPPP